MSSAILISSSPPRMFARSPTLADSSPIKTFSAGFGSSGNLSPKKFKPALSSRSGFGQSFTTARKILAVKIGAENSPLYVDSHSGSKQYLSVETAETSAKDGEDAENMKKACAKDTISQPPIEPVIPKQVPHWGLDKEVPIVISLTNKDVRRKKKDATQSLNLEKAVPRRMDWTPPRVIATEGDRTTNTQNPLFIANRPLTIFGYRQDQCEVLNVDDEPEKPLAKRRKIVTARKELAPKPVLKRKTSPVKKNLTITGLATSNYLGQVEEPTPMMQYLTSTQARAQEDGSDIPILETKVRKKRKSNISNKKAQSKSRLVSPQSALKTLENQDFIFASASQLAGDESPRLMRDTLEALKQSEIMSDPIATQRTDPMSIESTTPRTGMSRYRNAKNLWAAADRDEDDALLHIDDLLNNATAREVFAGKDVLTDTRALIEDTPEAEAEGPSMHGAAFDVDDIQTPALKTSLQLVPVTQKRALHTSAPSSSPRARTVPSNPACAANATTSKMNALLKSTKQKSTASAKPAFAGMTDHQLLKQLTSYGFKPIKKREKMIEMLEKCWTEKHKPSNENTTDLIEAEVEALRHGDFLSKVHSIAARPEAKVKKSRVRKEKVVKEGGKTVKKPRVRKKVEEHTAGRAEAAPEKPSKRNSTTKQKATVLDIDDLVGTSLDRLSDIVPLNGPDVPIPPVKKKRAPAKKKKEVQPPTPPPTNPTVPMADLLQPKDTVECPGETQQPLTPPSFDIDQSITRAIKHESNSLPYNDRNHQTHPTWHEKILLYDPIFLEDLTAWLNTEGLGKIGEDKEADIMQVRSWCESKGICCLWKGGWRGQRGTGSGTSLE